MEDRGWVYEKGWMGSIKHKKIQSISSIFNHVSISLGLVAWDLQWKTRLISIVSNLDKVVVVVSVVVFVKKKVCPKCFW